MTERAHTKVLLGFNIEFDIFGKTPTPQQTEIVQGEIPYNLYNFILRR
jgi:methionyl-tRNA synthetase